MAMCMMLSPQGRSDQGFRRRLENTVHVDVIQTLEPLPVPAPVLMQRLVQIAGAAVEVTPDDRGPVPAW
jgi:hypothetical protein